MSPVDQAHKLALAQAYIAGGDSVKFAALKVGVSHSTLKAWLEKSQMSPAPERRGRPAAIVLTLDEVNRLRYWHLCRDLSLPLAVKSFMADPVCREETRVVLDKLFQKATDRRRPVAFPPSLRKLAHVTAEEIAHFRAKKEVQNYELVISRGLTFIDVDGRERPLLPNSLWESDDMSLNQPFRWTDARTGKEIVGRQTLCTIDVYSHLWLGAHPIGRDRDAYRAEDIAEHMEQLIAAKGLPYCWRLERGTWEGNFIHGIKLPDGRRWGGVDELFHVIHTWKSRGKGTIEGGFRYLQALLSHSSLDIGRNRGEYDFAARELRRAQDGQADALARFWTIEEAADALAAAMAEDNAALKERRAHGPLMVRADDLYKPEIIRPIPQHERWRLCGVKKQATVRNGKIVIRDKHYPYPFEFVVNDGSFPGYLADGTPVLAAFHPGRPYEGCHVFNGLERSDPRNRDNRSFGELITVAMPMVEAPQFSLAGTYSDQQRISNAAVRSEFREIVPKGSHPALKTSTSRDHLGNMLHSQTGETPAAEPTRNVREYKLAPTRKKELPKRRRTLEELRKAADNRLFD